MITEERLLELADLFDRDAVPGALAPEEAAYIADLRALHDGAAAFNADTPAISDAQFPHFMAGIREQIGAPRPARCTSKPEPRGTATNSSPRDAATLAGPSPGPATTARRRQEPWACVSQTTPSAVVTTASRRPGVATTSTPDASATGSGPAGRGC